MARQKVIMVGPNPAFRGGISSVIQSLLDSSLVNKFEIIRVDSFEDGNMLRKLYVALRGLLKLLFLLLTNKDVGLVHIHMSAGNSFWRKRFYFKLAKLFGKAVILHLHSGEFLTFWRNQDQDRQKKIVDTLLASERLVALSQSWSSDYAKLTKRCDIDIVYNPVNLGMYKPLSTPQVKSGKNLLYMGRISQAKGAYDLLEIIPELAAIYPDVMVTFAGDGEVHQALEAVRAKGIERNVKILGWVSGQQKLQLFQESDVFVLPSYNEGVPVSVLEAMGCGLPVIVTRVGGIPEIVMEGINGFLISPGDTVSLREKLIKLIEDDLLREDIGKTNSQWVRRFDSEKAAVKLASIYASLMSNAR